MTVKLIGLEKVQAHLQTMQQKLTDKSEFKSQAALLVVAAAQESFAQQGPGWAPDEPETIRRKRGRGQILVDTGKLLRSLRPQIGADYVGVFYGPPAYYGRFHQRGEGGQKQRSVRFTEAAKAAILKLRDTAFGWKGTTK